MPFVTVLVGPCRMLPALFAGIASMAIAAGPGYAGDARALTLVPAPNPMIASPSGADIVGKLLSERSTSSDPDVPLPQRDLNAPQPAFVPLTGPRIYGRGEEGSVVLGLKFPIPADRGPSQQTTRYGGADGARGLR